MVQYVVKKAICWDVFRIDGNGKEAHAGRYDSASHADSYASNLNILEQKKKQSQAPKPPTSGGSIEEKKQS